MCLQFMDLCLQFMDVCLQFMDHDFLRCDVLILMMSVNA